MNGMQFIHCISLFAGYYEVNDFANFEFEKLY